MKKCLLWSCLFVVCLLTSCGSEPGWVPNRPKDQTSLFGVGIADIGESTQITNRNQALQAATARAREDVTLQISASVKGMVTDYSQGSNNFFESVTRQLTSDILQNSRVEKSEFKKKSCYVLVSYKKADAYNSIETARRNSADNAKESAEAAVQAMQEAIKNLN